MACVFTWRFIEVSPGDPQGSHCWRRCGMKTVDTWRYVDGARCCQAGESGGVLKTNSYPRTMGAPDRIVPFFVDTLGRDIGQYRKNFSHLNK